MLNNSINNLQKHQQTPQSQQITTTNMSSMSELFELLDKLQSSRLDDQRCEMPRTLNRPTNGANNQNGVNNQPPQQQQQRPPASRVLDSVLAGPAPFPQVVVEGSSYWVDPGDREDEGDTEGEGIGDRDGSQGCTL